ncbi:MAG: FtsX-like permease family protein [bacterium]|nr:FtsX-like permease family protein [bacterium]
MSDIQHKPPRILWILRLFIERRMAASLKWNFEEIYNDHYIKKGRMAALKWFWGHFFSSLPAIINRSIYWSAVMFKNYLKIALRNIKRSKGYTFINVTGISVGMACSILIMLYIQSEMGYDSYHRNSDNIYRVVTGATMNGVTRNYSMAHGMAAPTFAAEIPGVADYTRLLSFQITRTITLNVQYNGNSFEEYRYFAAEPNFFTFFSYDFIVGDPETVLQGPNNVVITEEIARKIFGDEDPIDKILSTGRFGDLIVKGVVKNVPEKSHFKFDYIISNGVINQNLRANVLDGWRACATYTYVLLEDHVDVSEVRAKMTEIDNANAVIAGSTYNIVLQKLKDIHLRSNREFELESNTSIYYLYIFFAIAAFIIIIACINFINLSTATATRRAREVGLRKVFGAYKKNLITQFLAESIILSLSAMVIAVLLVWLTLPFFNGLSGKELTLDLVNNQTILLILLGLVVLTGIVAGSYPSFYISSFLPVSVLKEGKNKSVKSSVVRKSLVVVQFSISVFLIISTLIVLYQLDYMRDKSLGFVKEQILVVRAQTGQIFQNPSVVKDLKNNAGIIDVALSATVPGRLSNIQPFFLEGRNANEAMRMAFVPVDWDFIETYGLEIIEGRNFSREFVSDTGGCYIINEAAARQLGMGADLINRDLTFVDVETKRIVGVIKDFHFKSLKQSIGPLVLRLRPRRIGPFISIRFNTENTGDVLAFVTDKWKGIEPNTNIDFFFLDEDFDSNYRAEDKLADILEVFAFLTIVIACLGLYGLASFTAEQKIREIGIRKVLGSTSGAIIRSFSFDFIKLVILANLISWPLAYYFMSRFWLTNFAFRADLSTVIFLFAGFCSVAVSLITIIYHSVKAANLNPVESLRYE